jgi:hypothetical protein
MVQRKFFPALLFCLLLGFFLVSCGPNRYSYKEAPSPSQQYAPAYLQVAPRYYEPYSRSYNNPYETPPPAAYRPYYDQDYYYVPPTQYRYIENPGAKTNQSGRDSSNDKL